MGCLASKEAGAGGGGPGKQADEVASSTAQQHNAAALVQQEVASGAKHSSSGSKAEAAAAQQQQHQQQAGGDKKDKSQSPHTSSPQSPAVAEVSKQLQQQQPTDKAPAAVTPPSPVRPSQGGVDNPVSPTDIQLVNNSSTTASPRATEAAPVSKRRTDCKLRDVYKLGKTLGTGGFSIVKLAIEKSSGKEYACKIMALPPVGQEVGENENTREDIFKEIDLLCGMNHENVIYLKEYYEEGNKVFLITELLTGGELLDAVLKRGSYSEAEARNCFVQLLRGIAYLHSKHVTHRDLKLENLLLASPDDMTRVKIADFGLAKHAVGGMQTICGTPQYVAPEVIVGHKGHVYGPSVDMWSAGVVLYILLGGYPPFWSESEPQLFDQIRKGKYSFDDPVWQKVSDSAKDLIRRLLVVDPRKRLTAEQALHHPWLTDGLPTDAPALTGAQQNMQKQFRRKFRQAVGTVIGISRMQHMVSAVKAGELPAGNLAHDQALYQRMTHAAKQFEDAEQRKTNGGHSPRQQQQQQQQPPPQRR